MPVPEPSRFLPPRTSQTSFEEGHALKKCRGGELISKPDGLKRVLSARQRHGGATTEIRRPDEAIRELTFLSSPGKREEEDPPLSATPDVSAKPRGSVGGDADRAKGTSAHSERREGSGDAPAGAARTRLALYLC